MDCRQQCGACCIALTISSPIPGMPHGKMFGQRCVQLTSDYKCILFNQVNRPDVCVKFTAQSETCGENQFDAFLNLSKLEWATNNYSDL